MKLLLTTFMLLLINLASAQPPKRDSKNYHDSPLLGFRSQLDERIWWTQLSLNYISGTARGVKDLSAFKYYKLKERFPKLNDNFCDANKSYLNKYADRNPDNGAKFLGSTTMFVSTTDLWHLSQFINHTTLYVSMIIPLYPSYDRRLNWKEMVGRYATIIGANALGYHFAYDKLFRL